MTLATIRRRLLVLVTPRQEAHDVRPPIPPDVAQAPDGAVLDDIRTCWAAEMASPSFMILSARLR
ncbi:hypothetical protein AB0892_23250 [Streptomyces sp. NPDC005409]|uniref:hypothetical protein n=1 Tax=Streptomyces sp. NPDC005409 TaxID=3155342 RepID=UPI00345276F5